MPKIDPPLYPCDLHVHTMASDGGYFPEILTFSASTRGLKAIAVTDHDTLASNADAMRSGERLGLKVVPGVELTTVERHHILGYFVSLEESELTRYLEALRKRSWEHMLSALRGLRLRGVDVEERDLARRTGAGIPNMSHLIDVLYFRKRIASHAADSPETIELFGGDPDYMVNYFREFARTGPFVDAAGAVRLIRAAGGVPVWAHPGRADTAEIMRLRNLGLGGLEVITPKHDQQVRTLLNTLCQEFGLIPTGGTDYHGRHFDTIEKGRQMGHCGVGEDILERLQEEAVKSRTGKF